MLIDPPNTDITEEDIEDFDQDIDYNSLDSFFQPSEEDLDIATEDAIALNQFLNEFEN